MNRIVTLLISFVVLCSCNHQHHADVRDATGTMEDSHQKHDSTISSLQLNNGAKWKADSITNRNVKILQSLINHFIQQKDKSLSAYLRVGADLEQGLNKMISECEMKGSAHGALHQWLEPLIEKVRELKRVETSEQASVLLNEVEKQLLLYPQYFE